MKNTWMIAAIVIIVIVFGALFIRGSDNATIGKTILPNSLSNSLDNGKVQIAKLSVVNGKYVMNPSEFKVGVPVRIEADMANMPGCSKTIVIPSFNVRKSFTSTDNSVEFTPDKAGTFNIACSMNMYKGTFTVLQGDGTKANYVEQAPVSSTGGSCGMAKSGSGGCGCGG